MFLYPDNPVAVSIDFLKRIDAEEPGRWYGSVKWDGWRRIATKFKGEWTWRAKPTGSGELKPLPPDLQAAFEALPWPDGVTLDMEWVGNRMVENKPVHSLHVFDLLIPDWPYWAGPQSRLNALMVAAEQAMGRRYSGNVYIELPRPNPGLVDMFCEQLTNPLSEGLVVRRFDQKHVGHPSKCVDGNHFYKTKYRELKGKP